MTYTLTRQAPLAPAPKTYAQELGWQGNRTNAGIEHTGRYRAPGLQYRGWVLQKNGGLQFFIHKPPMDLLHDTDFSGCFHARNDGWWLISFKPHAIPPDLASGIAAIQKALRRAFEVRLARRSGRS